MTKSEIKDELKTKHLVFNDYIRALSEEKFLFSLDDQKWTAGQEMVHIIKSVSPLNTALALPKALMKISFGKTKRGSISYDKLVAKYHTALGQGVRVPNRFAPSSVSGDSQNELPDKLKEKVETLCKQLDKFTESELDQYLLPHPLLGKLTLREMLYFTIYHVQHHQNNSIRNLSNR